jgi:predicted alpha/beta-fold hydrolase
MAAIEAAAGQRVHSDDELVLTEVDPVPGEKHVGTVVVLHGFTGSGEKERQRCVQIS